MSRRDLKYESIAISVEDSLKLLDDCRMEFVEFVVGKDLADELPQNDFIAVLLALGLLGFDSLDQVLSRSGLLEVVFSEFLGHYSSKGMS